MKDYKGKIGYCDNKVLGLRDKYGNVIPGGHYVYINNANKDGTCDVNVITSLETSREKYVQNKITHIRKGNTMPIPFNQANFSKWSGVKRDVIQGVKLDNISNIGNKNISKKQQTIINKFITKKE